MTPEARRGAGADEGQSEGADHLGHGATQSVFGHGANLGPAPDGHVVAGRDCVCVCERKAFLRYARAGTLSRAHTLRAMRRRVTFSRNLTLSLSRTCRCYCKYCAFATHQAHLYEPEEVIAILDGAAKRQVKELLVLTGERPEVNPQVRARLARARPRGLHRLRRLDLRAGARARPSAAHEPRCALARGSRAPARGHRLAGADARVGLRAADANRARRLAHQAPARRLETIRAAGELRIPFTSGILVGIGETAEERIASLEALAALHAEHGHIQEVILQNFVPHQSYYGQEPAEIADAAAGSTGAPASMRWPPTPARRCRCRSGRPKAPGRSRSRT